MSDSPIPEIFVEELLRQVKAEARKHQSAGLDDDRPFQADSFSKTTKPMSSFEDLESFSDSEEFIEKKNGYHLNDFLKYHDSRFIENAYLAVLGRRPDRGGYKFYLDALRQAKMSKTEILGRLRYSPEGKARATKIAGLLFPFILNASYRIPILGYLFRWTTAIVRVPTVITNFQELNVYVQNHFLDIEDYVQQLRDKVQANVQELAERQTALANDIEAFKTAASRLDSPAPGKSGANNPIEVLKNEISNSISLASQKADMSIIEELRASKADRTDLEQLAGSLKSIDEGLVSILSGKVDRDTIVSLQSDIKDIQRQIQDHKLNVLDQQRRLGLLLEEVRKRLPENVDTEQMKTFVAEQDHLLDAFYVSFEDQFRGTRADIKKRQEVYIPYIEEIRAGTDELPVLDVGCGRGEWLELLKESGLVGVGVDRNRVMVQQCRENDLNVVEDDLIGFLRGQKARSFGAITGYHIIEHLPLSTFINLLDESYRVLTPGGLIIFETPNPENLIVGASQFYIDPTHTNPLFPSAVKYLAEQRGFVRTEIKRLHKAKEPVYTEQEYVDEIIFKANLEQDYALIGYKA